MNIILFEEEEFRGFSTSEGTLLVPLSDDRGAHIEKVLKLQKGDEVKVGVAGSDHYSKYRMEGRSGGAVVLSPTGVHLPSPPLFPLALIVGQVRPICMRRILRDAAGLGAGTLVLTGADNAEKSYAEARIYKEGLHRRYLLDGGMQAGSALLPRVLFARNAEEAMALAGPARLRILLDNVLPGRPLSRLEEGQRCPAALAIGPERGWSDRERALFLQGGWEPMRLGERVLRTETALPAAGALLLSRLGFL